MSPKRSLPTLLAAAAVVGMTLAAASGAWAVGTPANTQIDNYATVDFKVGNIQQTTASSDTASFLVDQKADVIVTTLNVAPVNVIPGAQNQVLTFLVKNNGNDTFDFDLSALPQVTSGGTAFSGAFTDNFDVDSVRVFVETGGNPTGYDQAVDTSSFIDELAQDDSVRVYVVGNIDLSRVDNDVSALDLTATTHNSGAAGLGSLTAESSGPDTAMVVQTVYCDTTGTASGDADNDGQHSARSAYQVNTADLDVSKTSAVLSDPVNGTSDPKAIPQAIMEYTIQIDNTGGANADSVTVVDAIPANTEFVAGSITLDGSTVTDGSGDDEGDFDVTNTGSVTVVVPSITASSGSAIIRFRVRIL